MLSVNTKNVNTFSNVLVVGLGHFISRSYEDSLAVTRVALGPHSKTNLHEIFKQNPVCHMKIFCIFNDNL